jgi:5-methylcytosine-specific restriction protein A
MKIHEDALRANYDIAKKVYENQMTRELGVEYLNSNFNMNKSSAADGINNFKCLITGQKYTRTNNAFATEYYLENIAQDYGTEALKIALSAVRQHIEYYENLQKVKMHKIRDIYDKYFVQPIISFDENEQKEIETIYKTKSRDEIAKELKSIKPTDPKQITINLKVYKRDNKMISLLKLFRDFKCQICGVSIRKKDGSNYIEAAHIKPKHQKGGETPDNIILLCPNHHKEFDFGSLEIVSQTVSKIAFRLNGNAHEVVLSVE